MVHEGDLLWEPNPAARAASRLGAYLSWLEREHGLRFTDYEALWHWSVSDLAGFWETVWEYFRPESPPYRAVLEGRDMPGATWFPGSRINYAREVLARARRDGPIIVHRSETRPSGELTREDLRRAVVALATGLRRSGVAPGDRVVGFLPNMPETAIAILATTAIGAIWSCCSPDFGSRTVIDRFRQLEPKVLIGIDGYRYGGREVDRLSELGAITAGLPGLARVVALPYLRSEPEWPGPTPMTPWSELLAQGDDPAEFRFADTAFDDPLWVLFTSGTTGLPKGIVHGHGGIVLELLKSLSLQGDLGPESRFFFYTTSGWVNFNILVSALATGAQIVLYDGHPAYPEVDLLWRMVDQLGITSFGASPGYVQAMIKAGIRPRERYGLTKLGKVVCTGAPVGPEHFAWFYSDVKSDLHVASASGGTEVCAAFFTGNPLSPVRAGEMQCRSLGVDVQAWNNEGKAVVDELGELVVTQPMPSMPLRFWNDPEHRRYRETYFATFPGVWCHGDLLKITLRGSGIIYGRSDSTLNRGGVRIGTGEIYRIVESIEEIADSLAVNLDLDGKSLLLLFVVPRAGVSLTDGLRTAIADRLVRDGSPRHTPDRIEAVEAIPYTLTGKKMEVPVKRILLGMPAQRAASCDAMADPAALDDFIRFGQSLRTA